MWLWARASLWGGAALGARLARSAVWQRAFWQVSILGILTLLAAEATGVSTGIVQWWHVHGVAPGLMQLPVARRANASTVPFRPSDAGVEPLASLAVRGVSGPGSDVPDRPLRSERLAVGDFGPAEVPASNASDKVLAASVSGPHGSDEETGIGSAQQTTSGERLSFGATDSRWLSRDDSWDVGLGVVWSLVAAFLLTRLAGTRWRLQRFRHRQRRLDHAGLQQRVEQLAGRLRLRRRIDLLESPCLAGPIAFGVVRPVIALPTGFLNDFDLRQQDAMLAHELAHLAAGDPVWQLLADIAAALLWWHPLVWSARRQWRSAGELAADEASLLVPQGADTLAACLVEQARRMASGPHVVGLAMAGPGWRSALGRRVERLLELSSHPWCPPKRGRISVVTATIAVALFLAAVSCTAWARTRAPDAEGVTTMKVFVDGWRQSLVAVTLAAVLGPASGDISQALAAEGERDVPRITVAREGEREEAPREHAERKPEARPERERGPEGGEAREAHMRELAERRAHLLEQAGDIRGKLQALQPHQDADARELKGALQRIEVQLRELQPPAPNRERVQARLEELRAAHHRAREAGRADEAERLGREAHELMRMLEPHDGDRPAVHPQGGETQRRLKHLHAAIENLRAAGLNDQANSLARDAERLVRGERPASPEGARRPETPRDGPAPVPHLERAVQELRGQVQELRHQMEEIRQHLKELAEKR